MYCICYIYTFYGAIYTTKLYPTRLYLALDSLVLYGLFVKQHVGPTT